MELKEIYSQVNYIKLNHFQIYKEFKRNYPEKIIKKNGILHSQNDMKDMRILTQNEIKTIWNIMRNFGNDYLITEMVQILPLYGLYIRRNEL